MKHFCLSLLLSSLVNGAFAQCLSGDCKAGKGKYDFGWCVYEGEFKNEKPDGEGSMKYDDYTYTGSFKNGVEDGKGVLVYKNGKREEVLYSNGKKLDYKPTALKEGEYKSLEGHDPNCTSGNCETGYGTYVFPSGNRYTGNFSARRREGKGVFYFADGNKFDGYWHSDQPKEGTFSYTNGASYTGTYDTAGKEWNGVVTNGLRNVPFVNGKAVIPPATTYSPQKDAGSQTQAKEKEVRTKPCASCHGKGFYNDHVTFYGSSYKDKNGSSVFGEGGVRTCGACKGKGFIVY